MCGSLFGRCRSKKSGMPVAQFHQKIALGAVKLSLQKMNFAAGHEMCRSDLFESFGSIKLI